MTKPLSKSDFQIMRTDKGRYRVTYTDLKGRKWADFTEDHDLINHVTNGFRPRQKRLIELRKICKK